MRPLSTDSSETRKAIAIANGNANRYAASGITRWRCVECGETWSNEHVGYYGPVCDVECGHRLVAVLDAEQPKAGGGA